ncbi:DNA polymerase III subunit delta [Zoogloea oryzae]|uniref:DNA polymerase III subunit delta n=1 Tax=Zoogloea oryzae TaxID=310767 RepID=A0ABQ6F885_9RHOO|nr:DNA polymerase III subunit delta [Zoogloea oryzae]GLT20892.1 DNA polymerase III subunit delta [Zoogloea oryzae]
MNLRPEQLAAHLDKPLAPLYVLHGNEPLLVLEAGDAIRAAARKQGYAEREVLVAGQGFKWTELQSAAGNLSLFGASKLVDLRIPNGKPGRDGGEALQRYAKTLDDGIVTLITLPELDWATRKAAWFVALCEAGVAIETNAPDRDRLPDWIAQRLARQQQKTGPEALAFIADHVEGNLLAAHQEILKLGLLHPPGELSFDAVREAILNVARYNVDSLRQAMLEGDAARCARLLEGLKGEGEAPPLILWALANEIRTLANLRQGLDEGQQLQGLMKAERIFDDRRRLAIQRALPRLDGAPLRTAILHAARIDRMIKGLVGGDVWDEFLQLCLRLTRGATPARR